MISKTQSPKGHTDFNSFSHSEWLRRIDGWSRKQKRAVFIGTDLAVFAVAFWAAFALRLGRLWPAQELLQFGWLLPVMAIIRIPVLWKLGLYRAALRFSAPELYRIVLQGVGYASLAYGLPLIILAPEGFPRSTVLIEALLAVLALVLVREAMAGILYRLIFRGHRPQAVIIYGAGMAGQQLARLLLMERRFRPVAFVDDSPYKVGSTVAGLEVRPVSEIKKLADRWAAHIVLLGIPSLPDWRREEVLGELRPTGLRVLSVPGLLNLVSGQSSLQDLKEVRMNDLLGRQEIAPDQNLIGADVADRAVLVTGAGGSIGSELCRQVAALRPRVLILFEVHEFSLYSIDLELRTRFKDLRVIPVLASVLDRNTLVKTMQRHKVDTVYHAAAYKHVPIVEEHPLAGIQNNVLGTLQTAEASILTGVKSFVLISTDKAVRPAGVMGATKRVAELVCAMVSSRDANPNSGPRFVVVRFGNVLDSNGSVVPLFREQIGRGGPVTVTHRDVRRYFMTIPEAAQLVMQAGALGKGGETFVLDMGKPIKILDLARRMVQLADPRNEAGIRITFTGLRAGEKLHEELLIDPSNTLPTTHSKIHVAMEKHPSPAFISHRLQRLDTAVENQQADLALSLLQELVEGRAAITDPLPQATKAETTGRFIEQA